ncbi:MAG: hypothetical protein ACI9OJ_002900, partial [Myxococcota bacterium]
YCLYAADRRGRIHRGEIHHLPWPIQKAEAEISINTMGRAATVGLPDIPPVLHFARHIDVAVWNIAPISL